MITSILGRFRARLIEAFTCEPGQNAADALADDIRWGWLPALSGVAIGGEHARRSHTESMAQGNSMSG